MKLKTYGKLWREDEFWKLASEPHILLRIKRVFEKMRKNVGGVVEVTDTIENCRDLLWFIGRYPMEMTEIDRVALERGAQQHVEMVLSLEQMIDRDYVPRAFEMALPPRDYQARAAEIALKQGFLCVTDDLGLGKTATSICTMTDPRALPMVVVCYPHLQKQWQNEIARFMSRTPVSSQG